MLTRWLVASLLSLSVVTGACSSESGERVSSSAPQTVRVTVLDVSGRTGDEFAAVLYRGGDLLHLDREALGGFSAVISGDAQTLTAVVRQPAASVIGQFPHVTDQALAVEPGSYTLVIWVDETLTPVRRWVPVNSYVPGDPLTEGTDLYGCHYRFEVGDDPTTDIVVPANLHHNGWNVDCVTGVPTPGTDAAAAVAPPELDWWDELPTAMDPVTGLEGGQAVRVTVSGVADHAGHELAGVLYAGGELLDLDADALGGFWAVIDSDDYTTSEVIRTPSAGSPGRFPFVSSQALMVEPGVYTLLVWVDHGLGGVERWVPINTDGRGLSGCHYTFEVGDDVETVIVVPAGLHPDGWNVDCVTGVATPGTDAAAAVNPEASP